MKGKSQRSAKNNRHSLCVRCHDDGRVVEIGATPHRRFELKTKSVLGEDSFCGSYTCVYLRAFVCLPSCLSACVCVRACACTCVCVHSALDFFVLAAPNVTV